MANENGVALALIEQTHEAMMEMSKSLHGNGGDGVLTRVALNERAIEDLKERYTAVGKVDKTRWRALTEIAIAATAIASLAMSVFS